MLQQRIIILIGPTSSGKSALGVELAKRFNGEVISADSRQVYKGLDVATGKITKKEMQGVPHHLLDVASPKKVFTADDFKRQASDAVARIVDTKKLPIVVGGTGFYIDALVGRIPLTAAAPNPSLRKELESKSVAQLFKIIHRMDPRRAKSLSTPSERNNKVRLIRAIEIATTVGKSPKKVIQPPYDVLWIGIRPTDTVLKANINKRLHERMSQGMIEEARHLHTAGVSYKRMTALGLEYRSLASFLQKKITEKELGAEIITGNSQYARRQITYWKRNKDIEWFDPKNVTKIEKRVRAWLKK